MSHKISEVKYIDTTIKNTVFGYIRESESLFNTSSTIQTIPLIISSICSLFYHEKETFIPSHMDKVLLNDTKTIIKSASPEPKMLYQDNLCYGSMFIQPQKHPNSKFQWKIKLLAVNDRVRLGISTLFRSSYYAIESTGKLYQKYDSNPNTIITGKWGKYYAPQLKTDDIVVMEFNVKHRTLRYFINGINMGIAFRNIDITTNYSFGVSLRRSDKVESLCFQHMIVNNEIEAIDYDQNCVEKLFTFNLDISALLIMLLHVHTTANCNEEMETLINETLISNNINAKRVLSMGRKSFVCMLRHDANVKLQHGCKAFRVIERYILNRNVSECIG